MFYLGFKSTLVTTEDNKLVHRCHLRVSLTEK